MVICARSEEVLATAAKDMRDPIMGDMIPVEATVTDMKQVLNVTIRSFDGLYILVNNSGRSAAGSFDNVKAIWDWVLTQQNVCRIKEPITPEKLERQTKLYTVGMEPILMSGFSRSSIICGYTDRCL